MSCEDINQSTGCCEPAVDARANGASNLPAKEGHTVNPAIELPRES